MIKCEIDNRKCAVELKGNAETLFNDMIAFMKAFHSGIKEEDEEIADFFEWFIRNELGHVLFDEHKKDDEPKKDGKKKEESKDITDDIKELIGSLEQLAKLMKK